MKGTNMEDSDSYVVVARMIRAGDIPLAELERLLDSLEEQKLITVVEHESLLELGWRIQTDHPSPP
jgi:hypothetical protein